LRLIDARSEAAGWDGLTQSQELALQLFDGFRLRVDARTVEVPGTVQRLLAFLALRPDATREVAAGTLWSEVDEAKAGACLRSTLWRVNKASKLVLARGQNRLALADCVLIDFRDWTAAASAYLDEPGAERPVSLRGPPWAGELLPGWYDDWVLVERERMRQLHLHVLDTMSIRLTSQGRYATALDAALMAIRLEPLRESAQRNVVRVHLAEGNISEAIRAYENYRRLLHLELGVPPSGMLRSLIAPYYRQVRTDPPVAASR